MKVNLPSLGQQGDGLQHVLVVGGNERSEHLVKRITGKGAPDCRIVGFLDDDSSRSDALEKLGVSYLGPVTGLERLMIDSVIDCVYVCLPLRSSYDQAKRVLDLCNSAGVTVYLLADFLPLRGEPGHLWRMESPEEAGLSEADAARELSVRRTGFVTRITDAVSSVFSGLAALDPAYPRQQDGGRPRPPFPM